MLLTVLKIALLLGVIIVPLTPRKNKKKTATSAGVKKPAAEFSTYVINEKGTLEGIHDVSLTNHR